MLSKLSQLTFGALLILTIGCGIKMGETAPANDVAKIKSTRCLTQAVSDLKIYAKGEASDIQVSTSFTCLQSVLVAFKENVRGQNKDSYTPREVASFIELNFLDEGDQGFSDEILSQIMLFKVALLGGSEKMILKTEVEQANQFVRRYQADFLDLNSLLKIVNKNPAFLAALTPVSYTQAETQVIHAVENLSGAFQNSYDLENLRHFARNLQTTGFASKLTLPENFDALFDAVVAGKALLTGEAGSTVSPENLKLLLPVGIRAYLNYAEYDLLLKPFAFESLPFAEGLERLGPKIVTTLAVELKLKSDHVLKTDDLTNFVMLMKEKNLLKLNLRRDSVKGLLEALWTNLLNKPEDRLNGVARPGFDFTALQLAAGEIQMWIGVQKNISQIFSQSFTWGQPDILADFESRIANEKSENIETGLLEMKVFLNQPISLTHDDQSFLQILTTPTSGYRHHDLTMSNIARAISRLLIRAYAKDMARIQPVTGVLKEEIQVVYDQLKPIAVDLDIVDETNTTFITSRFLEASLFLSVSDGDNLASLREMHHLVIHLMSGIQRAAAVHPNLTANCLPSGIVATSHSLANQDCVISEWLKNETAFAGLPQFINMRKQFTPEEISEYYLNLLKAAGHVPNDQKTVLMSDADLFPHVVQYLEMVYQRHDVNRDNVIDKAEALAAFPVFKDLLKELVKPYKQIKEEYLPGVFVYILKYGRPPKPGSIGELLKFISFISDKDQKEWNIQATRLDLGKIFNYIAESTKPGAPQPAPAVVTAPARKIPLRGTAPKPFRFAGRKPKN